MYRITKEHFGFGLVFGGLISPDEMKQWRQEAVRALVGAPKSFSVLIDMRGLRRNELQPETQEDIADGIKLYKNAGMLHSCIVTDSPAATAQYKRRARESRSYFYERYINASADPRWLTKAIRWLDEQIDPDR